MEPSGTDARPAAERPPPLRRAAFARFCALVPQWKDVDAFGHVNNAEFYGYFDTAIVEFLIEIGAFAVADGPQLAMVAESGARFHREVHFGDVVTVGLAIAHLGTSSLRYRLAAFVNDEESAAVDGFFVHVFVDRQSRRPSPIPEDVRRRLEALANTTTG